MAPPRPHLPSAMPAVVERMAMATTPELLWRNELGGLTWRCGDLVVKWNPHTTGIDLRGERDRLLWLAGRHRVPVVRGFGADEDGQWLITDLIEADNAVTDR